jgi:hypothetical protein
MDHPEPTHHRDLHRCLPDRRRAECHHLVAHLHAPVLAPGNTLALGLLVEANREGHSRHGRPTNGCAIAGLTLTVARKHTILVAVWRQHKRKIYPLCTHTGRLHHHVTHKRKPAGAPRQPGMQHADNSCARGRHGAVVIWNRALNNRSGQLALMSLSRYIPDAPDRWECLRPRRHLPKLPILDLTVYRRALSAPLDVQVILAGAPYPTGRYRKRALSTDQCPNMRCPHREMPCR